MPAPELTRSLDRRIEMMTAGASPPAAVIEGMEAIGFHITHVYGLTEVYGPATVCAWHSEWDALPTEERSRLKARQGVNYPVLDGLMVADPASLTPVPADGAAMGEIFMRGNIVMKGYLKNPHATEEAFAGGWFHTGDLGVVHPDGYIELKGPLEGHHHFRRRKHLDGRGRKRALPPPGRVRSGGRRPPRPDVGRDPVRLRDPETRSRAATADEIIAFCREHLARFKAPRTVIFGPLPKTSTGKIQKFLLRERAKADAVTARSG